MQYILSEEEYKRLKAEKEAPVIARKKALQKLCTDAANSIVLKSGWRKGHVWGCILDKESGNEWYCDECPAQEFCPYPSKHWSK